MIDRVIEYQEQQSAAVTIRAGDRNDDLAVRQIDGSFTTDTWSPSSVGKYLFAQDVGVSAMVGQLPQHVQVDPAKHKLINTQPR